MSVAVTTEINTPICRFCDKPGPGWLLSELRQGWRFTATSKTWHCMNAYYYEEY